MRSVVLLILSTQPVKGTLEEVSQDGFLYVTGQNWVFQEIFSAWKFWEDVVSGIAVPLSAIASPDYLLYHEDLVAVRVFLNDIRSQSPVHKSD